jgi:hypothetical protein
MVNPCPGIPRTTPGATIAIASGKRVIGARGSRWTPLRPWRAGESACRCKTRPRRSHTERGGRRSSRVRPSPSRRVCLLDPLSDGEARRAPRAAARRVDAVRRHPDSTRGGGSRESQSGKDQREAPSGRPNPLHSHPCCHVLPRTCRSEARHWKPGGPRESTTPFLSRRAGGEGTQADPRAARRAAARMHPEAAPRTPASPRSAAPSPAPPGGPPPRGPRGSARGARRRARR